MKKVYVCDKKSGKMIEKKPDNVIEILDVPIPDRSWEYWIRDFQKTFRL